MGIHVRVGTSIFRSQLATVTSLKRVHRISHISFHTWFRIRNMSSSSHAILLPCHRMSWCYNSRLLSKKIPSRGINCITTALDTYAKHIINEVLVKHELDSLGPTKRPTLSEYTTDFSHDLIAFLFVNLISKSSSCITVSFEEENSRWFRLFVGFRLYGRFFQVGVLNCIVGLSVRSVVP